MADLKETLVSAEEARHAALVAALVQRHNDLQDLIGKRPFGTLPATTYQKALLGLPEYYVLGNADPAISGPWWAMIVNGERKKDLGISGPAQALAYSALMEELFNNPKFGLLASSGMSPELAALYQALKTTINPKTGQPFHNGHALTSLWTREKLTDTKLKRLFGKAA